jgi:primosomal protein N' (replication factor Y)
VPVGARRYTGLALETLPAGAVDPKRLKKIEKLLDPEPLIDAGLLQTLRWCSEYYHHPLGEVASLALPSLLRRGASAFPPPEAVWGLTTAGRTVDKATLARRAPRQARALEILEQAGDRPEAELRELELPRTLLERLAEKGWASKAERPAPNSSADRRGASVELPPLTPDQQAVLRQVAEAKAGYQACLLHGVTGSGKTEVYMRLVQEQLARGRQSLLLVPEISLTPQLVGRLTRRFGPRLALMHSGLTDRQRLRAWQDCRSGRAGLIVGTRSAVLAPLREPGLIIVDEEHDLSYKQQEGFRYSARDVAVYRAKQLGLPIVLGSATPSLESFHNAQTGRYRLLELPKRIGSAGDPSLRIIDLSRHAARNGLSTPLLESIERHLGAGNQIMLFLNRRGFAPVLFCPNCRATEDCRRCDSRMTIHSTGGRLRCHHCGAERPLVWRCEQCGSERVAVGAGTQRVSDELRALFPDARIARLDRDATARKGSLAGVLEDVERGEIRILVGTQMLTKGHDFPNVTLVGVLNADQGLFGTDFRCDERLAQTIFQVSGRAGRAERPGEVLVQTHYPTHPLFECLRQHDYRRVLDLMQEQRREANWPPFSHLMLWSAQATRRDRVYEFLGRVVEAARARDATVGVLGPAPASPERRGGNFRAQVLMQCRQRPSLHDLARDLLPQLRSWPESRRVRWSIDVDPAEI